MRIITEEELRRNKVRELGLDPKEFALDSREALAAAIRRAAGLICPRAASTLRNAVTRPLAGLVADVKETEQDVSELIESLTSHGDLVEERDKATGAVLLYVAHPSFVRRKSGTVILLGVVPDHISPLPSDMESRIHCYLHVRTVSPEPDENLCESLVQLGLSEMSTQEWLNTPAEQEPEAFLGRLETMLEDAMPSGELPGLSLLDPTRPVQYYKGRWGEAANHTGRFVGRRTRAYGNDLWCFVEVEAGQPRRLIDLPIPGSDFRGCDYAWRLQAAIDATRGDPQRYRVTRDFEYSTVDFFSPVPMWAQRRWDAVGRSKHKSVGSLFSYEFENRELEEELNFARRLLWLKAIDEDAGASRTL